MNKLSRIANIVDDFIYGKIPVTQAHNAYDTIIKPAYTQLSYRPKDINFYDGKQLRGHIEERGEVGFVRKYPELNHYLFNESYRSPEEILNSGEAHFLNKEQKEILSNYPQPTRELIKLGRAFQNYSNSNEGARLYSNTPTSDHREKAYKKWGFESSYNNDGDLIQYLDTRLYADNDLINKVYMIGDTYNHGIDAAALTLDQRVTNNKLSGSRIANLKSALPDIEDYITDFATVSGYHREQYNNPYLPQAQPTLTSQQTRDLSRFDAMRQSSRQPVQNIIPPTPEYMFTDNFDGTYLMRRNNGETRNISSYELDMLTMQLDNAEVKYDFD